MIKKSMNNINTTAIKLELIQTVKSTNAMINRLFRKICTVTKEIFQRIAFFFQSIPNKEHVDFKPISQNQLHQNFLPACLTAATFSQDDSNWATPFNAQSIDLSPFIGSLPQGFIYLPEKKTIVHKEFSIVIKLYETKENRFICFGSKTAIINTGLPEAKKYDDKVVRLGFQGALGINAPFFDPTIAIADFFKNHTPYFRDEKPTKFIGQSYGATLSEIAAIHTEKEAICFAPFQLGVDIQYKLGKIKLAKSIDNIKIIFVENDPLKSKSVKYLQKTAAFFRVRFPNNFGTHILMNSAYKSSQESHMYLLGSYMKALGHDTRTKPSQLDPSEIAKFR